MPIVSKTDCETARLDYQCPACGSYNVTADANADWDVETQSWVLLNVFTSMSCSDCDCDSNTGFEPYEIHLIKNSGTLSQDSIEAYKLAVEKGDVAAGKIKGYELAIPVPSPLVELFNNGSIVDVSEFSDEIPE